MVGTEFEGPFRGLAYAVGLWWALLGGLFLLDALLRRVLVRRGSFPCGGVWAACRHPLRAWAPLFLFPSLAFLLDDALLLVVAVLSFFLLSRGAHAAEAGRAALWGSDYRDYAARTRPLLPLPRRRRKWPAALARALVFLVCLGLFSAAAARWVVLPEAARLGTTAAERARPWAGDELTPGKRDGFFQAARLAAPPEKVWPWLAQAGYKRAGWYNFDAINRLADKDYFYEDGASATRVIPELQDLKVGDRVLLAPGLGFDVVELVPNRTLLLLSGPAGTPEAVSWLFALEGDGRGGTTLYSRFRAGRPVVGSLGDLVWGFVGNAGGALLQQPAMFDGLKRRVEAKTR